MDTPNTTPEETPTTAAPIVYPPQPAVDRPTTPETRTPDMPSQSSATLASQLVPHSKTNTLIKIVIVIFIALNVILSIYIITILSSSR